MSTTFNWKRRDFVFHKHRKIWSVNRRFSIFFTNGRISRNSCHRLECWQHWIGIGKNYKTKPVWQLAKFRRLVLVTFLTNNFLFERYEKLTFSISIDLKLFPFLFVTFIFYINYLQGKAFELSYFRNFIRLPKGKYQVPRPLFTCHPSELGNLEDAKFTGLALQQNISKPF